HAVHLYDGKNHTAFACTECHVVPETVDAPGHADERPAEIFFGELAKTGDRSPSYDPEAQQCSNTWCHGSADAVWTNPRSPQTACGTCHGLPPGPPHPQAEQCHTCHGSVIDAEGEIVAPELHVNGIVEYAAGECQECHGDADSAAPPPDTHGNRGVSAVGVGAHRAHLAGGAWGRPLACSE